jgi:hypothetical protein
MPIDFNKPATTDNYSTGFVPNINNAIKALGAMLDPTYAGTVSNAPAGTKRINAGLFQQFDGSTWAALAMGYALKSGDTFSGQINTSHIQQLNATYLRGTLNDATTTTRLFGLNAANVLYVGSLDAAHGSTYFVNDGSVLAALTAGGSLGIGTASPSYPLDVRIGDIRARHTDSSVALRLTAAGDSGAGSSSIVFNNNQGGNTAQIQSGSGSVANLLFYVDGTLGMRIDASRNVAIGTGVPAAALDINRSHNAPTDFRVANTNTGAAAYVRGRWQADVVSLYADVYNSTGSAGPANQAWLYTASAHPLILGTNNNARLAIDGTGNIEMRTNAVAFRMTDEAAVRRDVLITDSSGSVTLYGYHATPMLQGVNGATYIADSGVGTNRVRVDASGMKVGATTAPNRKLDVAGGAMTSPVAQGFSATPTFNAAGTNLIVFGNLTANVTSMTISNPQEGQFLTIRFRQDATGGRTVALPSGAAVSGSITATANKTSYLNLTYNATDSRWEGFWSNIP